MRNVLLSPWRGGTPRRLCKALSLLLRSPDQWEIDKFKDKTGVILNWGCSKVIGSTQAKILNYPSAVAIASNKMSTFRRLGEAKLPTLDWTKDPQEAAEWLKKNTIIGHWDLHGHSGHGLYMFKKGTSLVPKEDKGVTRVFTRYFPKKTECRVHLIKSPATGKYNVLYLEKKRVSEERREEFGLEESPTTYIRTYENGWIFARQVQTDLRAVSLGCGAMDALGLTYGAVDIMFKDGEYVVGEVNTAPGLEGEALSFYCRNLTPYLAAA